MAENQSTDSAGARLLACPCCLQQTPSLKEYKVTHEFLFLFFMIQYRDVIYRACPVCMRQYLRKRALANLPTAHFSWPFLVLPSLFIKYLRSFTDGHSTVILETMREAARAQKQAQQRAAQEDGRRRRF